MTQGLIIRPYRQSDRQAVRQIVWDTAFIGEPADKFFSGEEILADFLTCYFTDHEPQSCFVAESSGRVVGYLIGAKNASSMEAFFCHKILPKLLLKVLLRGIFIRKKNLILAWNFLRSFVVGEFQMPDNILKPYPATMHINLAEGFRGQGAGAKLVSAYLDYLKAAKISGVFLATSSDKAKDFFRRQGFGLIFEGRRSYYRHITANDTPVYIFAKKLI
jgi:GNAT superfamily N-acetyltransferase